MRQCIFNQCLLTNMGIHMDKFVAVDCCKFSGTVFDIFALIAVFGERNIFFSQIHLKIAGFQRISEFLNLVSSIIDIELSPNVISGCTHNRSQAVAQSAAAGIAHVHRTGWVRGYKFNHYFFVLTKVAVTVVVSFSDDFFYNVYIELLV